MWNVGRTVLGSLSVPRVDGHDGVGYEGRLGSSLRQSSKSVLATQLRRDVAVDRLGMDYGLAGFSTPDVLGAIRALGGFLLAVCHALPQCANRRG